MVVLLRIFIILSFFLLCSCRERRSNIVFTKDPLGYQHCLLSFSTDEYNYQIGHVARVSAMFKTQDDSLFWDSHNNLNDNYFFDIDTVTKSNFLQHFISKSSEGDSACLLISPAVFFEQQFMSKKLPYFCDGDSVVRIYLKIERIMDEATFETIHDNLRQAEMLQIETFFPNFKAYEISKDPEGFFWIEHPLPSTGEFVKQGDEISIAYRGQYLNGRPLENSAQNFEFVYGTPDQLIKGLNIVIGKLKLGQNAKIILPSRLAFGELGSSNGSVPPYTPLIYTIAVFQ